MNKLDSMLLQMEQFSEDKLQNLSGGFVEGSLSDYSKREAAESVTVFVAAAVTRRSGNRLSVSVS